MMRLMATVVDRPESPMERLRNVIWHIAADRGLKSEAAIARDAGFPQSTFNKKMSDTNPRLFDENDLQQLADWAGLEVWQLWDRESLLKKDFAAYGYAGAVSFDDIAWGEEPDPPDLAAVG